jgi:hypothetical protein
LKPSLQIINERQAFLAATFQALIGRKPVDLPLDIEQRVDPFDGLQCQWRDRRGVLDTAAYKTGRLSSVHLRPDDSVGFPATVPGGVDKAEDVDPVLLHVN